MSRMVLTPEEKKKLAELRRLLTDVRHRCAYSQVEVADMIGKYPANVYDIETGKRENFTVVTLMRMLQVYGADMVKILSEALSEPTNEEENSANG